MTSTVRNVQPGPLVGRGLTSEVFEYGADQVVKLYLPWVKRERIDREYSATNAVHRAGLPVPRAFEIVEAKERIGIVFERLHGISMLRANMRQPWRLVAAARELAEIHAQLHSHRAPEELPTQRSQIEGWLRAARDLSERDRTAVRDAMEQLPSGDSICHGDFHPENVIFTSNGTKIIDWITGTRGSAIGDVARTASLIRRAEIPQDLPIYMRAIINFSRKVLLKYYLQRYFQIRPGSPAELERWEPVQKAALSAWRAREESYP